MPPTASGIDPVRVFRALGNRARLRMVQELVSGERCVTDLVAVAGLSWATVSRHLAALREAGIVTGERRGNQILYTLALPCVATFASCLTAAQPGHRVELQTCCAEPMGNGRQRR